MRYAIQSSSYGASNVTLEGTVVLRDNHTMKGCASTFSGVEPPFAHPASTRVSAQASAPWAAAQPCRCGVRKTGGA